jgi:formamidopyrimidine-DNA glycosylase
VEKFRKGLIGVTIKNILRKAKVLILELSSGKALVIHLKMTGQLVLRQRTAKDLKTEKRALHGKNTRVSFHLSDGKWLDFNDQRLFAELRLLDDWRSLKFIQRLGPEPFAMDIGQFKEMLAKKKTKIKPLLLDQAFICGIGNLYAAEVLFRARIHPERHASSLSDKEKGLLFKEIRDTLTEAILHKGSSVDQYVQVSGQRGDYVKYHKVYDRKDKPCLVCKTPIQRTALGGRGTYFCPKCQR